jgi:hypothetical protein
MAAVDFGQQTVERHRALGSTPATMLSQGGPGQQAKQDKENAGPHADLLAFWK